MQYLAFHLLCYLFLLSSGVYWRCPKKVKILYFNFVVPYLLYLTDELVAALNVSSFDPTDLMSRWCSTLKLLASLSASTRWLTVSVARPGTCRANHKLKLKFKFNFFLTSNFDV